MTLPYFVARGETVVLDERIPEDSRGDLIACGHGTTHYELAGPEDGELVVLVGGLTTPLYYWDAFAADLRRRGFRTLAYSTYGRGYSERVTATYDSELFVGQLEDLVTALGLAPRHVVGSSMGALIGMAYVLDHVDTLSSLTVIGPAGLEPRRPPLARLLRVPVLAPLLGARLGPALLADTSVTTCGTSVGPRFWRAWSGAATRSRDRCTRCAPP